MNVSQKPLVDPQKTLLPPLNVKHGVVKIFVKAMDKNGEGFCFLKRKLPKLSEAKVKEAFFQGPQIRQLMLDCDFAKSLTNLERQTWLSVQAVINDFLGNMKVRNYKHLLNTML